MKDHLLKITRSSYSLPYFLCRPLMERFQEKFPTHKINVCFRKMYSVMNIEGDFCQTLPYIILIKSVIKKVITRKCLKRIIFLKYAYLHKFFFLQVIISELVIDLNLRS